MVRQSNELLQSTPHPDRPVRQKQPPETCRLTSAAQARTGFLLLPNSLTSDSASYNPSRLPDTPPACVAPQSHINEGLELFPPM